MPPCARSIRRLCAAVGAFVLVSPRVIAAQAVAASDSLVPPAAPADVRSLDAIMHAVYDAISGPAGPRDWQRFYSLFAKGARLVPTYRDQSGKVHLEVMSPQGYVRLYGSIFLREGFYEREVGRETNTFGPMTQVFDTYESRHARDDTTPFARGINSFQLFNDGTRWYVVTVYWAEERPGEPIPDRYLRISP
jgi:hypothetical protein